MSSHMLSLLCVSSCSLSHSASPSAVIMAGWSRWNCTCLKHALRCHPSLFPFLTVGARMAKLNEKRGGPNKSPAMLFTNHRLFPTLFAFIAPSLPPCSLPSFLLPPSVSKHTNHRKKSPEKKLISSFWVLLSSGLLLNWCEWVCMCVWCVQSFSCHSGNTLQHRRPRTKG